ncbi:MAG: T9SS type A sorting domain-containing protein, partial [Bacteroidota bacterium]|nr:T9SS type A sorting domain-containing protein [Bacteroidota bacterium]
LLPRDAADINQFVGLIENRNTVLDIYPNPTSDFIQIVSTKNTNASIFNMKGLLVKNFRLNSGINTINLGQLSSGNYMLYSEGNSYSIIVE